MPKGPLRRKHSKRVSKSLRLISQFQKHPGAVPLALVRRRIFLRLNRLYGEEVAKETLPRIMDVIHQYRRSPQVSPLSEKDIILIAYPDHIQRPDMSPLAALDHFWGETLDGLISGIHILPFYPTSGDKGFAVKDYENVDQYNGTWNDIERLEKRGRVMVDFVLNHCSSRHDWFKKFQAGDPKYSQYFYTDEMIDGSNAVRARATPLFTPFNTVHGTKNVWTSFGPEQPDLNYHSPDLLVDMAGILARYIQHGTHIFRFDAAHFVWKESGTSCINLPKAHEVVKIFRDIIDGIDHSVIVITETNQPHAGNITYFGNGKDEAQMVYNFAFPMLMIHSIYNGDVTIMNDWLANLDVPDGEICPYNYTACHDCINTRGASEILSEKQWWDVLDYARDKLDAKFLMRGTPEGEIPYEICLTYFDALSPPKENPEIAIDRFMVSQAIMLAMKGVAGVYVGSLFGAKTWRKDNPEDAKRWQFRELGGKRYEADHLRAGNMERYQEKYVKELISDPDSRYGKVFRRYGHMLRIRRAEPAFHPHAPQKVMSLNPSIFAIKRTSLDGTSKVLALHNVSGKQIEINLPSGYWQDMLGETYYQSNMAVPPYTAVWLKKMPPLKNMIRYITPK